VKGDVFLRRIFLVLGLAILMFQSIAFAHWMPREEMYVGGVGAGCTLGYVKSIYGEPKEKRWFNSDGVRGVTYKYSNTFSVTGRTGNQDPRAEDDLIVVGFSLKDSSLSTPSGLTVGIPYETVAGMFGRVKKSTYNGRISYSYPAPKSLLEMTFYVDSKGIIVEIYEGTDF